MNNKAKTRADDFQNVILRKEGKMRQSAWEKGLTWERCIDTLSPAAIKIFQ